MRHPELVGADLDPPSLVFGITPSPQGVFGLVLGRRKDVMLRLYHAFLGLRNRPQPLTGKGCLLHKQKILTALLMGPNGSASPLRAAYRRIAALRAKGCAAHEVTLPTGQIRRLT